MYMFLIRGKESRSSNYHLFLALEIDSEKMEIFIPIRKLQEIMQRIDNFLHREKVTLREMQSLIGVLNFA